MKQRHTDKWFILGAPPIDKYRGTNIIRTDSRTVIRDVKYLHLMSSTWFYLQTKDLSEF